MSTIIELKNISRVFSNGRGLHKMSLRVNEGEIIGLLGVNGSGKTTLMKIACGLTLPDTGKSIIEGFDVYASPEKALRHVGALIETPAVNPHLSAKDHLRISARYQMVKNEVYINRALEWAELDGKVAKEKVKGYSLGMKQRLALAIAFLGEKKVFFLDEPTNGLDIETAARVKDTLREVCKTTGAAAIVSSHLAGEIERLCTRIVILKDGNVIMDAGMDEVTKDGRTLEEFYLSCIKEADA